MAKLFNVLLLGNFQINNHDVILCTRLNILRYNITKFVSKFTVIVTSIISRCGGATIVNIGEGCSSESKMFSNLVKMVGQQKAEKMMPQKTCDSGLECDCDVTKGDHLTSKTCRCVDSFSKGIFNFSFNYMIRLRLFLSQNS